MSRLIIQATLALAVAVGTAWGILGTQAPLAVQASTAPPRPSQFVVSEVVGGPEIHRAVGDEAAASHAVEGSLLSPPVEIDVGDGAVELSRGDACRVRLDAGARASLTDGGWSLDTGRIQLACAAGSVRLPSGARVVGATFGAWISNDQALVATLTEAKLDAQTLPARHGARTEGSGWTVGSLPDVLSTDDDPTPLAFGFRRAGLSLVAAGAPAFLLRDPLGRWATPGRPSRDLDASSADFPQGRDAEILRRRLDAPGPAPVSASPPLRVRGTRAADPKAAARRRGRAVPSRERKPAAEPRAPAGDTKAPPTALDVDWTQLGRPEKSVLEGAKREAPAPPRPDL